MVSNDRSVIQHVGSERSHLLSAQFNRNDLISGAWGSHVVSITRESIRVENPATGQLLIDLEPQACIGRDELVQRSQSAQALWAKELPFTRSKVLRDWGASLGKNREDLARLLTLEQGKPIKEARAEIDYAASFLSWYAGEAERLFGQYFSLHLAGRKMRVEHSPLGVVGAFTPWNFPSAMITRKAAGALAAGCSMLVRPAPETPLSALALGTLAKEAGVPDFVFSVVLDDGAALAQDWSENPLVRGFSFTGSTHVGKQLLSLSAQTVKRSVMELGGHAPFLVFSDVCLEDAVRHAVAAKFATSGQDCLAVNRIYVERPIYDDFCAAFTKATFELRLGDGCGEDVDIGPLIGPSAIAKCEKHVADAVEKGAVKALGGGVSSLGANFFEPTVLTDVSPESLIWSEETFGPIAAIAPFDDEATAFESANKTEYALTAYVMTQDRQRIERAINALEFGMVAINASSFTGSPIPFGGMKQSGLGREGGITGIHEFLEQKYVCEDV